MSESVRIATPEFNIELRNEPTYTFGSSDNNRRYAHEHALSDNRGLFTSRHGVLCRKDGKLISSAVLGAGGGASGIHDASIVFTSYHCCVAVGPFIAALTLPDLELVWSTEVDSATCFGIHLASDGQALLSHGELEVARLTFDGALTWSAGGADIFSEGFQVGEGVVKVIDFEGRVYCFDEVTGRSLPDGTA